MHRSVHTRAAIESHDNDSFKKKKRKKKRKKKQKKKKKNNNNNTGFPWGRWACQAKQIKMLSHFNTAQRPFQCVSTASLPTRQAMSRRPMQRAEAQSRLIEKEVEGLLKDVQRHNELPRESKHYRRIKSKILSIVGGKCGKELE